MAAVQSIQRAFSVLRALSRSPMGVTQLSESVGLPKSTVKRLLAALEEEGAVEQIEVGGQYSIGDGLLDLSGGLSSGRNLVSWRPFLTALALEIDETVGLSVPDGKNVHYLDHVGPDTEVQVRDWTGEYTSALSALRFGGARALANTRVGVLFARRTSCCDFEQCDSPPRRTNAG